jgi:hypothetical protein
MHGTSEAQKVFSASQTVWRLFSLGQCKIAEAWKVRRARREIPRDPRGSELLRPQYILKEGT